MPGADKDFSRAIKIKLRLNESILSVDIKFKCVVVGEFFFVL